jgi:hypothetical protein
MIDAETRISNRASGIVSCELSKVVSQFVPSVVIRRQVGVWLFNN